MRSTDYVFIVLLVIAVCASVYFLLPAYTAYQNTRSEARELEERRMHQELEARELRQQIHAMQSDPHAIERAAREKLGWCREDEKVYHFGTPPSATGTE